MLAVDLLREEEELCEIGFHGHLSEQNLLLNNTTRQAAKVASKSARKIKKPPERAKKFSVPLKRSVAGITLLFQLKERHPVPQVRRRGKPDIAR